MIEFIISSIENVQEKEIAAILYEEYKKEMFRYAYSIVQDMYLAQDAVNQAFVGIIKNIKTVMSLDENKQKTYIHISVKHTSYNIINKKTHIEEHEKALDFIVLNDHFDGVEQHLISQENSEKLMKAVNMLPEKYRSIVMLKYFDDFSYKEISSIFDISVNQVGVILYRARMKLKNRIER